MISLAISKTANMTPKYPYLLGLIVTIGMGYYYEKKIRYLKKESKVAPHELY